MSYDRALDKHFNDPKTGSLMNTNFSKFILAFVLSLILISIYVAYNEKTPEESLSKNIFSNFTCFPGFYLILVGATFVVLSVRIYDISGHSAFWLTTVLGLSCFFFVSVERPTNGNAVLPILWWLSLLLIKIRTVKITMSAFIISCIIGFYIGLTAPISFGMISFLIHNKTDTEYHVDEDNISW